MGYWFLFCVAAFLSVGGLVILGVYYGPPAFIIGSMLWMCGFLCCVALSDLFRKE